jgi:hypothetical protein
LAPGYRPKGIAIVNSAHHRDAPPDVPASPSIVPGSVAEREADLLAVMVERIRALRPPSGAEALRALRDSFPESPLTLRVAALAITRQAREG